MLLSIFFVFMCNGANEINLMQLPLKDVDRAVYRKASGDWYADVAKKNCVPGSESDCTETSEDEDEENEESHAIQALAPCFALILSLVL